MTAKRSVFVKHKTAFKIAAVMIFLAFIGFFTWFVGKPIVEFAKEPEKFTAWVDNYGIWGRLTFILMIFIQVVIALIPGEPLEMVAGYAFGAVEGTILSIIGITLGSIAVFFFVRRFGVKFVEIFFDVKKIQELKFLQNEKKRNFLIFILFFLPGTPKDLLTYFIGLLDIKFSHFLIIVSLARLPSLVSSTCGGQALIVKDYKLAAIILVATFAVSVLGLLIYKMIREKKLKKRNK